jgi:hypothetical protein
MLREKWRMMESNRCGGASAKLDINRLQAADSAAWPPRVINAISELKPTFTLPAKNRVMEPPSSTSLD